MLRAQKRHIFFNDSGFKCVIKVRHNQDPAFKCRRLVLLTSLDLLASNRPRETHDLLNGSEPVVIPANGDLHLCHNRPIIRQAVGDGCCCLVPGDNGTGTRPVPVMFITAEPGLNV